MAEGAWVPAFDSLWTSEKTARLAKDLRTSTDVAGAKFLRLMSWMRDQYPSGDLGPADRATMARVLGLATANVKDDVAAERGETFYQALLSAGFLVESTRGHVKGWEDGPGKLVDRRASDRLRKEHDRPEGHPPPGDGRGMAEPRSGDARGKAQRVRLDACPKCRKEAEAEQTGKTGTFAGRSTGRPPEMQRRPEPVPQEFPRTERTERTEQREQGAPYPRPVGRMGGFRRVGEQLQTTVSEPLEGEAREERLQRLLPVLAMVPNPTWRRALEDIACRTSVANFETWFQHTALEQRDGWAIIRVPNAFAREWLESKYRQLVGEVLKTQATRVIFALADQQVVLEPEPVEDEEASS